jgi:uncharacterized membrane protein YuzA (DUF378 family)
MLINTSSNPVTTIATILAAVGALNWGLIGLFEFNLVSFLFGEITTLTRLTYILVGASGLYVLLTLGKLLMSPSVGNVK